MKTHTLGSPDPHLDPYHRAQLKHVFWLLNAALFYLIVCICLGIVLSFAAGVLRFAPWPFFRSLATSDRVWLLLGLPCLMYLCFLFARCCQDHSHEE